MSVQFRLSPTAIALVLQALLLGTPASLAAQADRWDRQVEAALQRAGPMLAEQGFVRDGASALGLLSTDESEQHTLPLAPGRQYAIIGVCDEDCGNLDLVLARSARQEVASDRGEGNVPLVKVTTTLAGSYSLKVLMTSCRKGPCRYGIAVYSRAASAGPR